jgi:hypothetical protein
MATCVPGGSLASSNFMLQSSPGGRLSILSAMPVSANNPPHTPANQ